MAKKYHIATLLLLIATMSYAQSPFTMAFFLKEGKLKELYTEHYKATEQNGKIVKGEMITNQLLDIDEYDEFLNYKYVYNRKGYLIEKIRVDESRDEYTSEIYQYNDRNQMVMTTYEWQYGREAKCDYNEDGKIVKLDNRPYNTVYYFYNEHGYDTLSVSIDNEDTLWRTETKYDIDRRIVEQNEFSPDEHLKTIIQHDYLGKITLQEEYKNGQLANSSMYEYDSSGTYVVKLWYRTWQNGELKEDRIRFFKKYGILIKEIWHNGAGVITQTDELTYNENDLLIKEVHYNGEGVRIYHKEHQYTYDRHNNWTQRIDFIYDEGQKRLVADEIRVRKIKYYWGKRFTL